MWLFLFVLTAPDVVFMLTAPDVVVFVCIDSTITAPDCFLCVVLTAPDVTVVAFFVDRS